MKKIILISFLVVMINCIFCTTCFASGSERISFDCYTTTNLTKNIGIMASSNVTVNWGDGTIEEYEVGEGAYLSHTYSETGFYSVVLSGNEIKALMAGDNDIVNINLLQAGSLVGLDLTNNQLSSIDLSNNILLKEVMLSGNSLTTLDINSDELDQLWCVNNKLTSLKIPNTVTQLYLKNNKLSDIELDNFSKLQILSCEGNNINTLDISDCTELEALVCSNNLLTEISLETNTKLKELYCSGNEISTLDISKNKLIEFLNCTSNKLTSLSIVNNVNLKELYILDNQLSNIDLNNINLNRIIVDNTTNLKNNKASILISVESIGSGKAGVSLEGLIVFSSLPNKILINDVEQANVLQMIYIGEYTGICNIVAEFSTINESKENITVNRPQIDDGMIPVKHNGENWVIINAEDNEWYNYSETSRQWANVMLRDNAYYLDFDGKTLKSIGNTPLDELIGREVPESCTGSMYVWVPRFSYKISDSDIDIKYSEGFSDYIEDGYKAHPAFNYSNYRGGDASDVNSYTDFKNTDKYLGLWVAKYPAGKSISSPQYSANETEILNASISEAFSASKLTGASSNYGLANATSHMMKNTEWGAVAYLTTGVGNLTNDSTTGNIYGIFGMNNTAEYVSSFIELIGGISNFSVRKDGKNLLPYDIISYDDYTLADLKDIEIFKLISSKDKTSSNYSIFENFKGMGIIEVDSNITGNITQNIPSGKDAFLIRGIDGIYSYSGANGTSANNIGFRNVILSKDSISSSTNETKTFIITSSSAEGGSISPKGNIVVKKGSSITYSIIPNEGYELVDVKVDNISVYKDLNSFDSGSYFTYTFENVDSNHKIHVEFNNEIKEYKVVINKNIEGAAEISGEGQYNNRSTVVLNVTEKLGYDFIGWEIEEGIDNINTLSSTISFMMPSNDVVLKANFVERAKHKLEVENLINALSMDKYEGLKVNIEAGSSDEYEFDYWTVEGVELTEEQVNKSAIEIEMPSNNVTLVANYISLIPEVEEYAVTLDSQNATTIGSPRITAIYGSEMPSAVMPERKYTITYNHNYTGSTNTSTTATYTFGGYYTGTNGQGTQYYTASGASARIWDIEEETTLYAKWTGGNVTLPVPSAREGYTFSGWYTESGCVTSVGAGGGNYTVTGDIILYAKWVGSRYTVNLNNQNATISGTASVAPTYGKTMPSAVMPERKYTITYNRNYTGSTNTTATATYTFGGYYTGTNGQGTQYYTASGASARNWNITENTTLYAKWTGGSVTLPKLTKEGSVFDGWYTDSACTTLAGLGGASYTATANVTLYAKWTANSYIVTFNANSGSGSMGTQKFADGVAQNLTKNTFTKQGYTFSGWATSLNGDVLYKDGAKYTATGNITLFAKWTPTSYSITYNLDGGTAANPGSYTIETANFTLKNPTRTGYIFAGWTGSNGTTPANTVTIKKGSTGNKSYTAVWISNIYSITTHSDEGATITGVYANKRCSSCGGTDHNCEVVVINIEASGANVVEVSK